MSATLEQRFVVPFDDANSVSRHVPVARLAQWMGRMRELAVSPMGEELVPLISSGDWGVVTNYAQVRLLGEATGLDLVETRIWAESVTESSAILHFDFIRWDPQGWSERVGTAEQSFTWVKIVDHGEVARAPFPPAMQSFMQQVGRPTGAISIREQLPEPLTSLTQALPEKVPVLHRHELLVEEIRPMLEESNLVGNIYYTNYFKWPGQAIQRLLWHMDPGYMAGLGLKGELLVTSLRIDFLREAMPFDLLELTIATEWLSEMAAILSAVYWRRDLSGEKTKLATGRMDAVWVERRSEGRLEPAPMPARLREILEGEERLPSMEFRQPDERESQAPTATRIYVR